MTTLPGGGTWASREMASDDVIVEIRFTLLPGGRVKGQGQLSG
jgi:hypothetical protein